MPATDSVPDAAEHVLGGSAASATPTPSTVLAGSKTWTRRLTAAARGNVTFLQRC